MLEQLGFSDVSTYLASGNAILESDMEPDDIQSLIQDALPKTFELDDEAVKVLALPGEDLRAIVERKPEGFGDQPDKYYSDAIFLIGIDSSRAMSAFTPREGVDRIWPGRRVVYSQRLSELRTKSRLNRVMASGLYTSMTMRSWTTTLKLFDLVNSRETTVRKHR